MKKVLIALLFYASFAFSSRDNLWGAEPGWSMQVIATGEFRQEIQSTPIEKRPYRPLHFYGNTIRRQHYRGTALPLPRGLFNRSMRRR